MEKDFYYQPKKRLSELWSIYPNALVNNIFIWLALLSFSAFVIQTLWNPVWDWWHMLTELSPIQWIILILGSIIVLIFMALGLVSFISWIYISIKAWLGGKIKHDIRKSSPNVLKALTPLDKDTKEYLQSLIIKKIELQKEINEIDKSILKITFKSQEVIK